MSHAVFPYQPSLTERCLSAAYETAAASFEVVSTELSKAASESGIRDLNNACTLTVLGCLTYLEGETEPTGWIDFTPRWCFSAAAESLKTGSQKIVPLALAALATYLAKTQMG